MNSIEELQTVLDDTAQDMAQAVPDPGEWSKFIVYFLEELGDKAGDREAFGLVLEDLQDYLSRRLEGSVK